MEDAYRTHKGNSNFGWALMLTEWLDARRAKRLAKARREGPWSEVLMAKAGGWHAPSAE